MADRKLYLCGGLQSSGSTLLSWCFLQRSDMDGVLDARFDTLPQMPAKLSTPLAWCKFTIACFRFSEVQQYLQDEGWSIRPLLLVRDVRAVFNSLITKSYGRNGVTADDPPLRLRLSRFLEDWHLFRQRGWPVVRYEDLAADPQGVLQKACAALQLAWDPAMMSWPKSPEQIADASFGNPTFVQSRGIGLTQTLRPELLAVKTDAIPPADLQWIEEHFADMNRAMEYPEHVPCQSTSGDGQRAVPCFQNTRRYERLQRKNRIANLVNSARGALGHLVHRRPSL